MAVSVDTASIGHADGLLVTSLNIDVSSGVGSSATNAIVCLIAWKEATISPDGISIDTVMWLSSTEPLTKLSEVINAGCHNEIWGRAPSTTSGADTVDIVFTGDPTGLANISATAFVLTGTSGEQATAFGAVSTNTGTSAAPTVDVTKVSSGGRIIGNLGIVALGPPPVITVGSGETEAAQGIAGSVQEEASYETTAADAGTTVTIDPTLDGSNDWSMAALEVIDSTLQDPILPTGIIPFAR